ncbi:hypothetical protein LEP1GSC041_1452 [Leptospira noguchii str. 2006001870]|uniref:hypothetical protein n=1 Tax=Leptospira noguchii TaxID=28182 RepID=UPI0002975EB9|nr:hypothetical protein [Leptospira noguchii]EKR73162.1 hypothetical protein LEP1GSC041_1452 [Leptospira noguchii str. 2006001870]
MKNNYFVNIPIILFFVVGVLFCSAPQKQENVESTIPLPISPPLFLLNEKDTMYIEKCSCSIRKLPMESGAGDFGNAFLAHLTPESDREFELTCKGKVTNKTQYKLQNVQFQWEYLSATKFPIKKGPVREYQNNYILPKTVTNINLVIGTDVGIKNFFTKEAKHYECKIISAIEVNSGEEILTKK